nr:uncharacterized protein LOC113711945 [Coffea arabica]
MEMLTEALNQNWKSVFVAWWKAAKKSSYTIVECNLREKNGLCMQRYSIAQLVQCKIFKGRLHPLKATETIEEVESSGTPDDQPWRFCKGMLFVTDEPQTF